LASHCITLDAARMVAPVENDLPASRQRPDEASVVDVCWASAGSGARAIEAISKARNMTVSLKYEGSLPSYIEPLQTVEVIDVVVTRFACKANAGQPFEQRRQRRLQLDPRQRRADAEMDASAEADVLTVGAERIEGVGMREPFRVAVGGAEHQADRLALPEVLAGVQRHVLERIAGEHVQRRVVAQAFFHRRLGLLRRREERLRIEAALEDGLHRVAGGVHR